MKDNFKEKLKQNYNAHFERYLHMDPKDIIKDAYHLNFINEWYIFLMSGFDRLMESEELINWLSEMDKPIDELYEFFLSCDDAPNYDWDVMYELLVSFMKYGKEMEENK